MSTPSPSPSAEAESSVILYRETPPDPDVPPEEHAEELQDMVAFMSKNLTSSDALDNLLIMARIFEFRASIMLYDTRVSTWYGCMASMLRDIISIITNANPDGPRPHKQFENPGLYWPKTTSH